MRIAFLWVLICCLNLYAKNKVTAFQLSDESCQTTSKNYTDDKIKTIDEPPAIFKCKREGKVFRCNAIKKINGEDYGNYTFKVIKESNAELELQDNENSYWILINLKSNTYTATNPYKNPVMPQLMSRFCFGVFKSKFF